MPGPASFPGRPDPLPYRLLPAHPALQLLQPYRLLGGEGGVGERKSTRSGGCIRSSGGAGKPGQIAAAAGATGMRSIRGWPQLQSSKAATEIGNPLLIVTAHLLAGGLLSPLGAAGLVGEAAGGALGFGAHPLGEKRILRSHILERGAGGVALTGANVEQGRQQQHDQQGGDRRPPPQRDSERAHVKRLSTRFHSAGVCGGRGRSPTRSTCS